jgi:acyl-[acyl-carrier-protein] desaturase
VAQQPDSILAELAPDAERLYERHLATCKPWYPHESVPWSMGRDFAPDEEWNPGDFPLPDAVRSALYVNLLTEDNLPYYFETINRVFGRESAWKAWSHRWTAEEARHSVAIRDYLTVTRAIDPRQLEDARMNQMSGGEVPQPQTPADGFVYVALQELATRIAHRNTGKLLADSGSDHPAITSGYDIMARVAADENFHYLFYRDITSEMIERDPSTVVCAIERQVKDFEMPGTGIIGYAKHAAAIATAGIYNLQLHHDQILVPVVLRHWKLEKLEGLKADAEQARERIIRKIANIGKLAARFAERAAEAAAQAAAQATQTLVPSALTSA